MAQLMTIGLNKGDCPNLGFRLQGGIDFATPLIIQKVNNGSPAERSGLQAGDAVVKINNTDVYNLRHKDAQDVIVRAGPAFSITIQRGGSTWKPAVTPIGSLSPGSNINNISPVTRTSLAAKPQASVGAIGTGHNVAAKPFLNGNVNGGPKLVNKQFNTPIGLYSEESIKETIEKQSEVLSSGAVGVNFKKNEKDYDASKSAVYHMLQEAEREPRDQEPEPDSGVITAPLGGLVGLKHVHAPENKPTPPTPQLQPGQNICADCERLIVGVFVRIKDKNLHVECFKCSTCGSSLKNVGYYNINNKLYCDIHAKLAAKSQTPGPNLVPVTVPPGGNIPAGTISAALTSHPLPSQLSPKIGGQLSPNLKQNTTASPFQELASPSLVLTEINELHNETRDDLSSDLLKSITLAAAKKSNAFNPPPPPPFIKTASINKPLNKQNYITAPKPFASVASPLSPGSNYSRPLPKVPTLKPVSPTILPPASAPSTPGYFASKPASGGMFKEIIEEKSHTLENIVWPPIQETSDCPTATPLYFPPPSQVEVRLLSPTFIPPQNEKGIEDKQKTEFISETDFKNLEDYTNYLKNMDPKLSLCSDEVYKINGRRSTTECLETLAEHLQTAMLVDSVMKDRPRSPPPLDADILPKRKQSPDSLETQNDQNHAETPNVIKDNVVSSVCPPKCTQSCCNDSCKSCPLNQKSPELTRLCEFERFEERKAKVQNSVPLAWESQMVQALRTTPDKPFSGSPEFLQIPEKHSNSALVSALAVAPVQPYNKLTVLTSLEPVPLPEETVPFLPPKHEFIIDPKPKKQLEAKESQPTAFVEALKIAPERPFTPVKDLKPWTPKKKEKDDPYLKDLPKPAEYISMLEALTTASDRSFTPVSLVSDHEVHIERKEVREEDHKVEEKRKMSIIKQPTPTPYIASMVDSFEGEYKKESSVSFEATCAMTAQLAHERGIQIIEPKPRELDPKQIAQQLQEAEERNDDSAECLSKRTWKEIAKQAEQVVIKKPLNLAQSLQKSEYVPNYQKNLEYDEELQLPHNKNISKLLKINEKQQQCLMRNHQHQSQQQQQQQLEQSKIIPDSRPLLRPDSHQNIQTPPLKITKPVCILEPGKHNPNTSFQTVNEDFRPPSSAVSQRLAQPSPSRINKPPSAIPYYQQNLVATEYLAPEINVLNPTSPAISRSPSPQPGARAERTSSPFRRASPKPKSPAPGPPPDPLQRHKEKEEFQEDFKVGKAKDSLTTYIPQHREKLQQIQRVEGDNYEQQKIQAYEIERGQVERENYQEKSLRAKEYQKVEAQKKEMSNEGNLAVNKTEKCKCEQLQALNKTQSASTEMSSGVQIQRKKTVTEEFEQTHSEKTIEIEKKYPFQKVNVPVREEQGIIGLHVTNPQRINSPFLQHPQPQHHPRPPPSNISVKPQPPEIVEAPKPLPAKVIPPVAVPKKIIIPAPPISKNVAASSVSQNVNPVVPAPSVGSGGRQAGGSVFAPKRGRGVLNTGGLGSRIASCAQCHQQIRGPFISALGKIWCPDHFTCATPSCRRPLQDIGFVEERGQLHCEYCFEQYLAPNCAKCNAKIKGDCLKAIQKNFHPECFNCAYCGKLFGNSPFFLEDGLPYCETDWNEMFTTKCFACGFPVEAGDRWVEALNNNYHSQCFNCTMCKKNLEGQSFFAKGGRPFCKNHAR